MKLTAKQARAMGITPGGKKKTAEEIKATRSAKERANALFDKACKAHGLPTPTHEYKFHPERNWRFDHVFEGWLVLEVQGGLFVEGRHSQGAALLKEHEKLNEAVVHGYSVLFCTPDDVTSGAIFPIIARALKETE